MKKLAINFNKGQSLAEFALTLPLLMLLIMGVFDLGRAVYYFSAISNAANEAARYGAIYHCDESGIEDVARQFAIGLDDSLQFDGIRKESIVIEDVTVPEYIYVSLTYDFLPATPLIGKFLSEDGIIQIHKEAVQRIEQPINCNP